MKALDAQLLESLREIDSSDSEEGGPTQLQRDERAERKCAQQLEEQSRRKHAMEERAARNPAGREFQVNMAAVASMGLPPLRLIRRIGEGYVGSPSLPQLLLEAFASGLVLQARIVDFWSGSRAIRLSIRLWLEILGFSVLVADDCVQIGASCGYVAARATGIMFAAGNEWLSVDVSDAAEETWISLGNALLENGEASDAYLETQHVHILAQLFHEHVFSLPHQPWDSHSQAFPSMSWPLRCRKSRMTPSRDYDEQRLGILYSLLKSEYLR